MGAEEAAKVPMQAIGGVRVPKDRAKRPWRPIPGLEEDYGVTQTGQVWSVEHGELWDPDNWPRSWLPHGDGIAEVHVIAAVALTWLDAGQRAAIRERAAKGARHGDLEVAALEKELQVSKHAVALVANKADEEIVPVRLERPETDGNLHRIENAEFTGYETYLHEPSRPPSGGGNTSALHSHVVFVDGQKYTFFARGSKKWAYKGDRVSFAYRVKDGVYRNVIRTTFVTQDKTGRSVVRGDRRAKQTLRTTQAKMPASRRERRDNG